MKLQIYAFYFMLSLVISAKHIPSKLRSNKKVNSLVTTKNDYIFKHILVGSFLPIEYSEIREPEVIKNNQKNELNEYNHTTDIIIEQEEPQYQQNFLDLFQEGVAAYLKRDWLGCISLLERSIVLYQDYYNTLTYCRVSCDHERSTIKPMFEVDYDHYHFYEGLLHKTLCLEKCRRSHLSNLSKFFTVSYNEKMIFKKRKPYDYLQICYYRDKDIKKAINAAFTALIGDTEDEMLLKNIKYYASLKDFDYETMVDLENKEFSKYYAQGVVAYRAKQWNETIENFEKFIELWIQDYDKCRAFCEDDFQQGWLPDFTTAVANHYVYVLRCKANCTADLTHVNGRRYDNLFQSAYHYLQFTYYQVNEIKKGAQSVVSYLLFDMESEDLLHSLDYYKAIPNITDDYFTPRQEAKRLSSIQKYEKALLEHVDKEFSDIMVDDTQALEYEPEDHDVADLENQDKEAIDNTKFAKYITEFMAKWKKGGKIVNI